MLVRMVNYRCHLAHESTESSVDIEISSFVSVQKNAKITKITKGLDICRGVLPWSLTKFISGFRCSTGVSLLIPTKLFHLEVGLP
jgi:hypothetical protein